HHGNDIGGSLRMPAFACGVTTIKPTQGRLPAYNPSAAAERGLLSALMSSQGIIARSVADVRLVTRVMAQRDPRDPLHAPVPWEIPGPAGPVKVAVTTNGHGYPVHPEIVAGVERAAAALADAGYAVAEAEPPPVLEAAKGWFSAGITELKLTLDDAVRAFGSDDLKAVFDQFYAHGEILDLAGYRLGLSERTRMVREWLVFLEENPVVLSPYFLRPTVPYDYDLQGDEASQDLLGALVYSVGLNFLGLPAGVVPVGFAGGLPAGVQLVGSRFRENLVLDAMEAIELRVGRLTPQLWAREAATR
ncbi:MAG TPA: amidase family protein, partial [Acidimicrobiales bacterium]